LGGNRHLSGETVSRNPGYANFSSRYIAALIWVKTSSNLVGFVVKADIEFDQNFGFSGGQRMAFVSNLLPVSPT
jgi:hypothetical protein